MADKKNDNLPDYLEDTHKNFKPLHLTVAGGGGSRKSTLVKVLTSTIRQIFQYNDSVLVSAPTGSASFNGGGVTMHRLFGIPVRKFSDKIGSDKMRRLKIRSKML